MTWSGNTDQNVQRAFGRHVGPLCPRQTIARRYEALTDESLPRIAGCPFQIVYVGGNNDNARIAGALDNIVKGRVVDDRCDQGVRASCKGSFHIRDLLGDRSVSLHIDHLAIGRELCAGVFVALLNGLPERVRCARMDGEHKVQRLLCNCSR